MEKIKEGRWYLIDLICNITQIPKDKIEKGLVFKNSNTNKYR